MHNIRTQLGTKCIIGKFHLLVNMAVRLHSSAPVTSSHFLYSLTCNLVGGSFRILGVHKRSFPHSSSGYNYPLIIQHQPSLTPFHRSNPRRIHLILGRRKSCRFFGNTLEPETIEKNPTPQRDIGNHLHGEPDEPH